MKKPDNQAPSISPAETARRLHAEISELRNAMARDADQILSGWHPSDIRDGFLPSAQNLADYLAFRKNDLREMQEDLAALGLSSLGRCEAHVRPSLDAVLASLAAIGGIPETVYPSATAFSDGQTLISAQKDQLFGRNPDGPPTRIMVTLPTEAGEDPGFVRAPIAAGADCMRVNCAHDSKEIWAAMFEHTRAAEADFGRDIRVEMDLVGRKMRTGQIRPDGKVRLKRYDQFVLTASLDDWNGPLPAVTVSHPQLIEHLVPGTEVWIDDGKIGARVMMKEGQSALLEVRSAPKKGVRLKPEKGINCPGVDLELPPLSAEDLRNLDFMVRHADLIGYSFVETPEDVRTLIDEMSSRCMGKQMPGIVLKIETERAVRNLPRLIVEAGGRLPVAVMIARGDLAVEIGLERLSEIQEEMLWLCEAAHVPVVWATQVLDGLLKDGRASRAETTDAAMGQRAECVMLNKGKYLTDALVFLSHVLRQMERHQGKKTARLSPLMSWQGSQNL